MRAPPGGDHGVEVRLGQRHLALGLDKPDDGSAQVGELRIEAVAAPEEVWKLLYDPSRFPEWWAGVATIELGADDGSEFTLYPEGYPDFPMPQLLERGHEAGRVTISCMVSDLRFDWRLQPAGVGTRITVDVEIPDAEAHRLDTQRELVGTSLRRLAEVAATG